MMKKNQQTKFKSKHFQSDCDHFDVSYKRDFLTKHEADKYFRILERKLVYNSDEDSQVLIMGKKINIPRKQIAYGEPGTHYSFAGNRVATEDWNSDTTVCRIIQNIRNQVEQESGKQFNFVLINRYADGTEYIGFHSDDEKELGDQPTIVGVTLGAERPFQFKPRTGLIPTETPNTVEISLAHGSYVSMNHPTNRWWKHSIPKKATVKSPRISLTFRNIVL